MLSVHLLTDDGHKTNCELCQKTESLLKDMKKHAEILSIDDALTNLEESSSATSCTLQFVDDITSILSSLPT